MNTMVIYWLALAGPLWAVLGAFDVPARYKQRGVDEPLARVLGVAAGFALGPVGGAGLHFRPMKANRFLLPGLTLVAVILASQALVRVQPMVGAGSAISRLEGKPEAVDCSGEPRPLVRTQQVARFPFGVLCLP